MATRFVLALSCLLLVVLAATDRLDAHKPITSKYTYNDDVFPIVRDRCGRCHVAGGVGPMSLLVYKDAYPWAESIRGELLAAEMPPWHALEGFGPGTTLHTLLSPRELDVLLVWATGGTPQGNAATAPAPVALKNDWPLGPPDLVLPMPSAFVLPAEKQEDTYEFAVPTGLTRDRWVAAIDVRPGTPAMVRHASVSLHRASTGRTGAPAVRAARGVAADGVLAQWVPGADPVRASTGRAIRVPAGAQLAVRIHYKRTWTYEGTAMTDRSRIGLYFREKR